MLKMNERSYFLITSLVFLLAGVLHGYRAFTGLELTLGDWLIPIWVSSLAALVLFLLAFSGLKNLR